MGVAKSRGCKYKDERNVKCFALGGEYCGDLLMLLVFCEGLLVSWPYVVKLRYGVYSKI